MWFIYEDNVHLQNWLLGYQKFCFKYVNDPKSSNLLSFKVFPDHQQFMPILNGYAFQLKTFQTVYFLPLAVNDLYTQNSDLYLPNKNYFTIVELIKIIFMELWKDFETNNLEMFNYVQTSIKNYYVAIDLRKCLDIGFFGVLPNQVMQSWLSSKQVLSQSKFETIINSID